MRISVVAAQTGLHPNTIYRLVRGKGEPTLATLRVLSEWIEARK